MYCIIMLSYTHFLTHLTSELAIWGRHFALLCFALFFLLLHVLSHVRSLMCSILSFWSDT